MRAAAVVVAALVGACGPSVADGDGAEGSSTDQTTSGATTSGASTTAGTTASSTTATTSTSTGTDVTMGETSYEGGQFVDTADIFGGWCDPWLEDCARGEKCMPWANDGGATWNAYKCVPIAPDPKQVGEPCTVEGSGTSGIDDCDIHSMCWYIDPDTLMGECVPFCIGSEAEPACANACEHCMISGDAVLTLCLPGCDPIAQDCGLGKACYPLNDRFACMPDVGAREGAQGAPCEYINFCDSGLFCANAEAVPGCAGVGCCASYCDIAAANPCPGAAMGVECVPWWEEGQAPMDGCTNAMVGACVLPQ